MEYKTAKRMESLPFSEIRAVMEKATKMQQAGEKVIHLEIGRPDFDTPEKIKEAAYESLKAGHVFYTSNYGVPALRKEIAEWETKNHGVVCEAEEVLVTVGVGEATYASMAAFLQEGDEVLVPNPVWLNYIHVPGSLGAKPVTYSLREENDYQIDFAELEEKLTDKTKMIVIVNPSNPTGGVFSRDTLEKLSKIAVKYDLLVVADEIYSQLVYDGVNHTSIASLPGMKERTITLGGFSKAYSMTGWRLGYMCAPKKVIQACVRVHQYTVTCAPSFVQEAGITALRDCAEDVEIMRKEYQRRKDYMVKALNEIEGISCNNPQGAFYIFVNIKSLGMPSMEVAEYLLDSAKIALVPGAAFGSEGEGYLRVSYACSYEDLQEACVRIKKAVAELRK
ncbi:pyridoxal phosphate-dependent aminotransferase [Clostridium sp. C105KSO13]|uniref:pyridoxal phosphate-dependent aminotransferase n=1 Tax=Clostridium sp. C105KSO13 TaxID=1776045 RepID=UPI00074066E2|nr:pyridoxal phosphate-dependent aminotransferase [Clostridium sp. C105KSO13]CUX19475.1 Arginine--pyruvate transaminase AruH [Clostridium sp. C105KSO13]